ncbi:MAG: glycosyltransferase family 2 protein [Sedimentisphaerales bacterium]|nr:glycosyltransferase family 2 protein [Sedimentisphaerales bacterium]
MKLPVSVIIPTKNESENILPCLRSVNWADQVFVVDSQSTDGTTEKAKELGATVIQFHYDGGWPKKKNWAMKNLPIKNDWLMILDADERVTDELRDEISKAILSEDIKGYYLQWKFMFLGRWQKHSWSHGWMLRLLRRDAGEYEDLGMRAEGGWDNEVHENIVVNGKTSCLKKPLLHKSNQSLSEWIKKQNQFSDWNAIRRIRQLQDKVPPAGNVLSRDPLKRRKFLKAMFLRTPCKPFIMFNYLYFIKLGILDGVSGFYFCMLRAIHEFNISAKIYEMKLTERKRTEKRETTIQNNPCTTIRKDAGQIIKAHNPVLNRTQN